MDKKIKIALVQRKIDSNLAENLITRGFTLGKLKQLKKDELSALGIMSESIEIILNEGRPPIPEETVRKLLYESNYTCCICKDKTNPVIIHHIIPWEESKSHDISNLVVLCLLHHGEAHTKHELSLNLTADRIRDAKQRWLEHIKEKNIKTILNINNTFGAFYDYFNIFRIFELTEALDINPIFNKYYNSAFENGFINELGFIKPISAWSEGNIEEKAYWLDFFEGTYLYHYLKGIFTNILSKQNSIYLNEIWSRTVLNSIIGTGTFVLVQGVFSFKSKTNNTTGIGQIKYAYRKAKGIKVECEIDVFYCNSNSSRSHLSGRNVKTVCGLVRSCKVEKNVLVITCSALAIGTSFTRLDDPYSSFHMFIDDEDEFEEFNDSKDEVS